MAKNDPKKPSAGEKSRATKITSMKQQQALMSHSLALAAHANALTAHALALSAHTQALSAATPPLDLKFKDVLRKLMSILAQLNGNPDQDIDPNLPISTVAPNATAVALQWRIDQDILQNAKVFPISLVDLSKTTTNLADSIVAFASSSA